MFSQANSILAIRPSVNLVVHPTIVPVVSKTLIRKFAPSNPHSDLFLVRVTAALLTAGALLLSILQLIRPYYSILRHLCSCEHLCDYWKELAYDLRAAANGGHFSAAIECERVPRSSDCRPNHLSYDSVGVSYRVASRLVRRCFSARRSRSSMR